MYDCSTVSLLSGLQLCPVGPPVRRRVHDAARVRTVLRAPPRRHRAARDAGAGQGAAQDLSSGAVREGSM